MHTWKCFQGFCFLPPFIPAVSLGSANFSAQRLQRKGPAHPETPARGRALAMARSPAREGGSAARTPTAGVGMGLRTDAGFGSLAAPCVSSNRCPLHTPQVRGRQEQQLQNNAGRTGDASTPDAPRVPPSSGVGEEKPDGDDYRAPRSFPLWSGNVENGAAGDGGEGSLRGTQGESPNTCFSPQGRGDLPLLPSPLRLPRADVSC